MGFSLPWTARKSHKNHHTEMGFSLLWTAKIPTKITTLRWVFLFHELLEIPTKNATLRWVSSSHQQPFPLKSSPEMGFLSPTNSHSIKNSPQKWDFPHLRTVIRSKITPWDGIHYFGTVFLALLTLFLSFVIIHTVVGWSVEFFFDRTEQGN